MGSAELVAILEAIEHDHRHDGDGGYELVADIRKWMQTLSGADHEEVVRVLCDLVEDPSHLMQSIALETLTQERVGGLGEHLVGMLRQRPASSQLTRSLVSSLLRIGHTPAADLCREYAGSRLKGPTPDLAIVASLARVDSESSVDLASRYFAEMLRGGNTPPRMDSYCEQFVFHFMETRDDLLGLLVRRTQSLNPVAGRLLAALLIDCLREPSMIEKRGAARVSVIIDRLEAEVSAR